MSTPRTKDAILQNLRDPGEAMQCPLEVAYVALEVLIDIRDALIAGNESTHSVEIVNAGDISR